MAEPAPMGFDLDRLSSLSQRTGSETVQRPESHLQAHPRYRKEVCLLGRRWQLRLFRPFENLVRGIGDGVIRGLHSYKVAQQKGVACFIAPVICATFKLLTLITLLYGLKKKNWIYNNYYFILFNNNL